MNRFVIESFDGGQLVKAETVEHGQRLLNEEDAADIAYYHDRGLVFIRRETDVTTGYYLADDDRWDYGTREEALKTIKRRISWQG